ncbi:MAG: hypothetical protein R6V05_01865 [Candidatus Brocadiia bacterium]
MRVLVDIKHPAEVNFFRPLLGELQKRGDEVLVSAHYKYGTRELLDRLSIPHVALSHRRHGFLRVCASTLARIVRMLSVARPFRPDVLVARQGVTIGAVGRTLGVPSVSFDENEYAGLPLTLSRMLATVLVTGMGYETDLGPKQVHFNAVPQLMYTHPSRFSPDAAALRAHGVEPDEPYFVVRLSAWEAMHDVGHQGMSERALADLVEALSRHGRVVASAEADMPAPLRPYANPVPMELGLDLLAFADLYVGEGATMAAEAACLGTPAVWVSPLQWGFINVLADGYGLVKQTLDVRGTVQVVQQWLSDPCTPERVSEAHELLLADSEDPLPFILRLLDECVSADCGVPLSVARR